MDRFGTALPVALFFIICGSPLQALTGDLNCNGRVELSDFFIFADSFGTQGEVGSECAALVGDFDCDSSVDLIDFFIFADNFGNEGVVEPDCGTIAGETEEDDSADDAVADFHTPQVLADILATTRSATWTSPTGALTNLTRLSLGIEGTQDLLVIDDNDSEYAAALKVESDMIAGNTHTNDALARAMFKLIEVGIDTYMLVSAKHSNYAVDFDTIGGVKTLVMRDYRSYFMDASTAGFLTFTFTASGSTTHITASERHAYSTSAGSFVADGSWTSLNVAIDGLSAVLTTQTGTAFTAFSLYLPTLDQEIPFDFNPAQLERVSNDEFLATWDASDKLADVNRDVMDTYEDQVVTAGLDASTTIAADAMLSTIESTLAAEGSALRYPADFYKAVRQSMLARKVEVSDNYDAVIGKNSIPYVYFTNETDSDGVHHPFMVIASYGVTEGMTHLWDVPRPPGDGTPGTEYGEQKVTRNAVGQVYMVKIPIKDYGEVESLTENTMENDLASDAPVTVDFDHLNFASISATGIAIDGVPVYPTLNNALNVSASAGELSSIGIHSGQGLGVHYHADAYSATHSGLNLYNAADYEGYSHPPIISLGFDGVAGYGIYLVGDTTSDGIAESLDDWSGHEHGIYGYHYHSETSEQTVEVVGPDGGTVSYTAHIFPPKGAWRGRINPIPDFWDGSKPGYGGRGGRYHGIE